MAEVVMLAMLMAWMWREWEHSRERRTLWERVAGVQVPEHALRPAASTRAFGDAAEWEIERERTVGELF